MATLPPLPPFDVQQKLKVVGGVGASLVLLKYLDSNYYISKDVSYIIKILKLQRLANAHIAAQNTIADVWEQNYKQWPKKPCFLFENTSVSFEEVDQAANRVAHWAQSIGIKKGDVVALHMDNRPEYFMTWLGIAKAGGITALINYNLKGKGLVHSIKISNAKVLIVGSRVQEPITASLKDIQALGVTIYGRGEKMSFAQDLDAELPKFSDKPLPKKARNGIKFEDTVLLVYTSGTTGLPKAAAIKHLRLFNMGAVFVSSFGIRNDDIIYTVLPLYHSAGGLCGTGMMLQSGATQVLRAKFSLRDFWDDCRKYNATVIQYIGELCRYLVGAPKQQNDHINKVRIAIGNGLRPEIWDEFQDRFNIPEVGEFYGSTEGNAAVFNHCTEKRSRGSVGQMGPILFKLSKMKIAKFDVISEEPVRGPDGFLIECKADEPGELLGEIVPGDPVRGFDGYHGNKEATQKKILTDAFTKGDAYFRTGDLMKRDKHGYVYFVDRIGDTFRWKGENVSTTEVAEAIATFPGIVEVNVYGVEVPGADGRACMAAAVLKDDLDWKAFAKHCRERLPPYAMPLFVRKLPEMEITSTFKHQKGSLRKQGIDVTLVKDQMWWYDPKQNAYVPFGLKEYEEVAKGRSKL